MSSRHRISRAVSLPEPKAMTDGSSDEALGGSDCLGDRSAFRQSRSDGRRKDAPGPVSVRCIDPLRTKLSEGAPVE